MGNTYGVSKVRKDKFLKGKSRFVMDSEGRFIEDYNPDYIDICVEWYREDFLCRYLGKNNKQFTSTDSELQEFVRNKYDGHHEQACVISIDNVEAAIKALEELDAKVKAIPYEGGDAHIVLQQFYDGKANYHELWPLKEGEPEFNQKIIYGTNKNNVEMIKAVEKIYGHRYYHYKFPWDNGMGAEYLIKDLKRARQDMLNDKNGEYVYLFTYI